MKMAKKAIIIALIFLLFNLLIFSIIQTNSYASASTNFSASSYNVTTGTTVNITVGVNSSEAWQLSLSASGGSLGGTTSSTENPGSEVTQTAMNATFSAANAGSYTISLSGYVASSDDVTNGTKQTVSKSITITVTAPAEPSPTPVTEPSTQPSTEPSTQPSAQPTAETEPTFSSVSETVVTKSEVNFRESYSTNSNSIALLPAGTELTRTGVGSNGWSRVTYNGSTGYVFSNNLEIKVEENQEEENEESTEPTIDPAMYQNLTPQHESENNTKSDSSLDSILIKNVVISPIFNSTITNYIASVKLDVNDLDISVTPRNKNSRYEISGNTGLQVGENIVKIKVTSEDGTASTEYQIKVIKGEDEIPLNAIVLNGIRQNEQKIAIPMGTPTISGKTISYEITLKEGLKSLEILGISGKYNYDGTGIFELVVGDNEYTITLKQKEDESKTVEYKFKITNPENTEEASKTANKIDFKIVGIIVIATLAVLGLLIGFISIKSKKSVESEKIKENDYSFLHEDEQIQEKEEAPVSSTDNESEGKKGGKHF